MSINNNAVYTDDFKNADYMRSIKPTGHVRSNKPPGHVRSKKSKVGVYVACYRPAVYGPPTEEEDQRHEMALKMTREKIAAMKLANKNAPKSQREYSPECTKDEKIEMREVEFGKNRESWLAVWSKDEDWEFVDKDDATKEAHAGEEGNRKK
jgi:hypothetical protein